MKRFLSTICLIVMLLSFSMTSYAKGVMYPHAEVKTEITSNEGEQKSQSGRTWKTVYGTALRPDMEYGELRYTVYLPENYDSKKEYPFLLYLHGGSTGYIRCEGLTVWENDLNHYAENFAEAIEDVIIFAPQAPGTPSDARELKNAYWSGIASAEIKTTSEDKTDSSPYLRAAEKLMADFLKTGISYGKNTYNIDSSRLYVAGHSMGGIGTYTILRDCPGMFAAAIIGAGIGDPDSVDLWADTPVRIIHGTKDSTIPYKSTQVMAVALKEYPNVEIKLLQGEGHTIKPFMYQGGGGKDNLSWMAQQVRDEAVDMRVAVAIIVVIIASAVVAIWIIKRRKASKKIGGENGKVTANEKNTKL